MISHQFSIFQITIAFIIFIAILAIILFLRSYSKKKISFESHRYLNIYAVLIGLILFLGISLPRFDQLDVIEENISTLENQVYRLEADIRYYSDKYQREMTELASEKEELINYLEFAEDQIEDFSSKNAHMTENLNGSQDDIFFDFNDETSLNTASNLMNNIGEISVQSSHHLKTTGGYGVDGEGTDHPVPWDVYHYDYTLVVFKHLNNDIEVYSHNFNGRNAGSNLMLIEERRQGVPDYEP